MKLFSIEVNKRTKKENRRDGKTVMKYTAVSAKRRIIGTKRKVEEWAFICSTSQMTGVLTNPMTLALWSGKKYIIQAFCKGLERRVEGDYCA